MFYLNYRSVTVRSYTKRWASFSAVLFIAQTALVRIRDIRGRTIYIAKNAVAISGKTASNIWTMAYIFVSHTRIHSASLEPQLRVVGKHILQRRWFICISLTVLLLILRRIIYFTQSLVKAVPCIIKICIIRTYSKNRMTWDFKYILDSRLFLLVGSLNIVVFR